MQAEVVEVGEPQRPAHPGSTLLTKPVINFGIAPYQEAFLLSDEPVPILYFGTFKPEP
jgi:hypothetical protein